jgi:hypothetical protein
MTNACCTQVELIMLLDGELTENRATAVRAHLEDCRACRGEADALRGLVQDVARPVAPLPGAMERLMSRLDEAPRDARRARWRGLGAILGAAAVLVLAVGVRVRSRSELSGGLVARGVTASHSIERDVGVTVYRGSNRLDALRAGDDVDPGTAYSVGYRNLGPNASAFAAVFAQDARGEVHWIAPAWLDPHEDPSSEPLRHADREAPPAGAVVLDRPAPGDMHVFVVVTERPLRVSEVEGIGGALDPAGLRARWPQAVVDETVVRVGAERPDR